MTLIVSERDEGSRIRARVGDTIEVRLAENAATGYRWSADDLDTRLFEVAETLHRPAAAIGSAGEVRLRIHLQAPGSGALRLKCWRAWEGDAGVLRRFTVTVDVAAG